VLRALCSEVVTAKHGTGSRAGVDGLDIAGKTGTAQISDGKRYIPGVYSTSFVGFAPSRDPQLLIAIVLHRVPSEEAFGGNTAAPCAGSVLRSIAACTEHLDGAAQPLDEVRTVAAPSWLGLDANAVRDAVDNEGWMVSGKIPVDGRVVGQLPAPGATMVARTRIQIAWHRESR
jgi:membrane peptidoglycan carboxypeptidase